VSWTVEQTAGCPSKCRRVSGWGKLGDSLLTVYRISGLGEGVVRARGC
jgi:hypothetical protein